MLASQATPRIPSHIHVVTRSASAGGLVVKVIRFGEAGGVSVMEFLASGNGAYIIGGIDTGHGLARQPRPWVADR